MMKKKELAALSAAAAIENLRRYRNALRNGVSDLALSLGNEHLRTDIRRK